MSKSWFDVDKDGLKEMFANFPPERMVTELIQNSLDEKSTACDVAITSDKKTTTLVVEDDNPDGFKDLRDAYTMFKSTGKRSDPTKRGKFNLGEKIVLARANTATIRSTLGTVVFDDKGRLLNPSFTDNKIPTAKDLPFVVEAAVVETPQLDGPYGARGVGEHPMISVAPAIGNAIGQATGAQLMNMPIRAEDVWRGMTNQEPIDNWITKSPAGHCRSTRLIGADRVAEGTCAVPQPLLEE